MASILATARAPARFRPQAAALIRRLRWRRPDLTLQGPGPRAAIVDADPGQFVSGFFANEAGARPYKLYVPTGYATERLPLVVMLHGCDQSADSFATATRMNALADERKCIVLYPEQTHTANRLRCWNWFKRSNPPRNIGEAAILAGMTLAVIRHYRVDRAKVYVAGLSAGGAMAAAMGAAYPEIYAAVGVHSGLASGSAHDLLSALAAMRGIPARIRAGRSASPLKARIIPTIVFHGDQDRTVHPRNAEQLVARSLEQSATSRADASIERGRVPGGHAYTRTRYRDGRGRAAIEYWRVHGGGHAWFGGEPDSSHSDPKGPDAAREMIRFFYQSAIKKRLGTGGHAPSARHQT